VAGLAAAESAPGDVEASSNGVGAYPPTASTRQPEKQTVRAGIHYVDRGVLAVEDGASCEGTPGLHGPSSRSRGLVLSVRVTGDVVVAERELRTVWGGALCVSPAERTVAELYLIQREIMDSGDARGSWVNKIRGIVEVIVFVDHGRQAAYDERYGPGTVAVTALLQPID
jgi:hypothetical protein